MEQLFQDVSTSSAGAVQFVWTSKNEKAKAHLRMRCREWRRREIRPPLLKLASQKNKTTAPTW